MRLRSLACAGSFRGVDLRRRLSRSRRVRAARARAASDALHRLCHDEFRRRGRRGFGGSSSRRRSPVSTASRSKPAGSCSLRKPRARARRPGPSRSTLLALARRVGGRAAARRGGALRAGGRSRPRALQSASVSIGASSLYWRGTSSRPSAPIRSLMRGSQSSIRRRRVRRSPRAGRGSPKSLRSTSAISAIAVGDPTSAGPREFALARDLGFRSAVTTSARRPFAGASWGALLTAANFGKRTASENRGYGRSAERRALCTYKPQARRARSMRLGGG